MKEFFESLSNREISVLIWMFLFFSPIAGVIIVKARKETFKLLKAICNELTKMPFSGILLSFFIYVFLCLYSLYKVGFWDISLLKDTIIWVFGIGFVLLFKLPKVENTAYFKVLIKDTFKWFIIIEFITDFYTFNIWIELFIVPFFTLLVVMMDFTEKKKEHFMVYEAFGKFLGFAGTCLLLYIIYKTITQTHSLLTLNNFKSFLIPLILTVAYIPLIYIWALCDDYFCVFIRINAMVADKATNKKIKRIVMKICKINLNKISNILKNPLELDKPNIEERLSEIASRGNLIYNERNKKLV